MEAPKGKTVKKILDTQSSAKKLMTTVIIAERQGHTKSSFNYEGRTYTVKRVSKPAKSSSSK